MSLDLPIKEGYDLFLKIVPSIPNFFMIFVPEEVRSTNFLPFGRINQIDNNQSQSASNKPIADEAIVQIDIWSTDLMELNNLNKVIDTQYNQESWICVLTDLEKDEDSIFETVTCYRLIKRFKKNRIY